MGVSKSTISSSLHSMNFSYKSLSAIPELSSEHKRLRVEFSQKMLEDPSQIYRIWFSDEMGCQLEESRKKVWTQKESFIHTKPKRGKVNVWAAISAMGKTNLD